MLLCQPRDFSACRYKKTGILTALNVNLCWRESICCTKNGKPTQNRLPVFNFLPSKLVVMRLDDCLIVIVAAGEVCAL